MLNPCFLFFGFLYVRRELAESLTPAHLARYGVELEGGHETAYGDGALRYGRGARRFDLGNYNYLGMSAVRASLRLLEREGIDTIERHVRGLAAALVEGFAELGVPVAGGDPGPHLAHIVCVGSLGGGRHYTADDPAINDPRLLDRRGWIRGFLRVGTPAPQRADPNKKGEPARPSLAPGGLLRVWDSFCRRLAHKAFR